MPFKKLIKDDFWKRVWIQKQLRPDSYSQVVPARESVWWEVLSLLDLVDWDESDDDWLLLQLVTFENEGSKSTIMKIFFFWQSAQWLIFDSLKLYFVSPIDLFRLMFVKTFTASLDQNKHKSFWPFWPFSGMVAKGRQGSPKVAKGFQGPRGTPGMGEMSYNQIDHI